MKAVYRESVNKYAQGQSDRINKGLNLFALISEMQDPIGLDTIVLDIISKEAFQNSNVNKKRYQKLYAKYRWGNWRKAHMLPAAAQPPAQPAGMEVQASEEFEAQAPVDSDALMARAAPCERIAIPAEVGGQPPSTVATLATDAGTGTGTGAPPRDATQG